MDRYRVVASWIVSFLARAHSAIRSTAWRRLRWLDEMPHSPMRTRATEMATRIVRDSTVEMDACCTRLARSGTRMRTARASPTTKITVHRTVSRMRRPTWAWELAEPLIGPENELPDST